MHEKKQRSAEIFTWMWLNSAHTSSDGDDIVTGMIHRDEAPLLMEDILILPPRTQERLKHRVADCITDGDRIKQVDVRR